MSERIQKALATAGIASRREIERLIAEGRILVNGRPAEIGQHIDSEDKVRVDGRPVALQRKAEAARVLIYKKRVGEVVTTTGVVTDGIRVIQTDTEADGESVIFQRQQLMGTLG